MAKNEQNKTLANNRSAYYEYFIEDKYEAGIELKGTEVKSIRQGKASLKECYAELKNGEVFIVGMHVSPYEQGNIFNVDPMRKRKLLLHKSEIRKLKQKTTEKGYTLTILSLYLKNGKIKAELAVVKGKKLYDKREDIAKKDAERRMRISQKESLRGE